MRAEITSKTTEEGEGEEGEEGGRIEPFDKTSTNFHTPCSLFEGGRGRKEEREKREKRRKEERKKERKKEEERKKGRKGENERGGWVSMKEIKRKSLL